jgi:dTDP-4-dehydrorhamnose reductase
MRVYVAGCGGMLGEAVYRVLRFGHDLKCTDIDLNAPWLEQCDFRDFTEYRASVEAFNPDLLIHLGANTDLELCENYPGDAYRTNTLAVEHACTLASTHGVPLVYISTAGVFDGSQPLYDDWDTPNPLGVYARSKHLGEIVVQQRVPQHFIFRAGWMMGGGPEKDKKFIGKLMKQLEAGATVLNVVNDKLGTPTYTVDFVRNLQQVVKTDYYGLYNMACQGETGRLEVARELIDVLGLSDTVEVRAVSSEFFARDYFAPRPASERLLNWKLDLRGLNMMRDWRVALRDYIRTYFADYVRPFAPGFDPAA